MSKLRKPVNTMKHKKAFLQHYRELCVIGKACEATGISRSVIQWWRENDKSFVEAFEGARQDITEKLEVEAIRRAYEGVDEPVYYRGFNVGTIKRYADTLLIFLLKGAAPEKYRERAEISAPGGGPLIPRSMHLHLADGTEIKPPRNGHYPAEVTAGDNGHGE